jgi:hypothetical protein
MRALGMVQVTSGALALTASRAAVASLIAASGVQLALAVRRLVLVETRREIVWALLVEGRDVPGLAVLGRERRRLADPRRRVRLARSLELLADMAQRPASYLAGARPYFNAHVVRAVAPELRQLAVMLRAGDCDVRGVALLQSLQSCGASPLYGNATRPAREQLKRARYLLLINPERPGTPPRRV